MQGPTVNHRTLGRVVQASLLACLAAGCGSSDSEGLSSSGGKGGAATGGAAGSSAGGSASGGAAGSASGGAGGAGAGGTGATAGTGGSAAGGAGGGGGSSAGGGAGGTSGGGGCGGGAGGACGNDGTSWNSAAQAFECQVIDLLNQKRAAGLKCGTKDMPAVAPLARNQILTNSARAHSEDMSTNSYVDLVMKDGTGPIDWSMKGYCGTYITADVGGGQAAPSVFLATLLNAEPECVKLMSSYGKGVGVGYFTDATGQTVHMWTLVIGSAP